MALPVGLAVVDPVLADQAAGEIDKGHLKHPLTPIGAQHRRILLDAGKKAIDGGGGMALGDSLGFQPGHELRKRAAAVLRQGG